MKNLKEYASLVNARLEELLPKLPEGSCEKGEGMPWLLADAMRYSLLAGGKRLRPCMLLAAVDMLGGDINEALDIACCVEMIHTYSLIHDDLPGMDNDTMRRGRPTNHVVFGEGQAILAGDGLLNFAFERMLGCALRHPGREAAFLKAIYEIASGSGVTGMIAGQVMDLYCENNRVGGADELEYIQLGKTACMFIHPLRAAGYLAGASQEEIDALGRYGEAFGILFQATDDLLDVEGDAALLGKNTGMDAALGKLTWVAAVGVEQTRRDAREHIQRAVEALGIFGESMNFLKDLAQSTLMRVQ